MIRPLTALSNTAHEVAKGNLNVPQLPVVVEDEVGIVTRSFNQMLESIRQNIEQLKDSMERQAQMKERELLMETHLKEAQLKYLQAQINPHFLFNSLNAGAQLAMMGDADKTGVFLEKMADFFRYNVRKMEEDAMLWEEVEAVDNYIYILNVRFAGDITYIKEVDEGIENIRIPSMILQPLVENAIVHSVEVSKGKTVLNINGYIEQGNVVIEIKDDGVGMDRDTLLHLLDPPEGEEKDISVAHTGLGMYAVHQRLRYLDGEEYGLTADSEPGNGTCIKICIPFTKGEEKTWS